MSDKRRTDPTIRKLIKESRPRVPIKLLVGDLAVIYLIISAISYACYAMIGPMYDEFTRINQHNNLDVIYTISESWLKGDLIVYCVPYSYNNPVQSLSYMENIKKAEKIEYGVRLLQAICTHLLYLLSNYFLYRIISQYKRRIAVEWLLSILLAIAVGWLGSVGRFFGFNGFSVGSSGYG